MEGILALSLTGAFFITWLTNRHKRKMRELELRSGQGGTPQLQAAHQQISYLTAERDQLEQRLRNLETIVCSVDFELNAKLNRLASQQLRALPSSVEHDETEAVSLGSLQPGSRLAGRFVIKEQLGAGGMGAVYLAHDEQLGESVALKVIAGAAVLDPGAAERFRREVTAARKISHPNVVRIHDLGEESGMLFLSMEHIAGTSLSELLRRHGRLDPHQLRPIIAQICAALEVAHGAGVIHRDLKPGNILLDERQQVKVIDFGLAALPHLEGMTATGIILGTPEYMAPEQIRGQPVDPRTDIYALGALMFHALVGHPPFRGDSPIAVSFAQVNQPVPPPDTIVSGLAPAWSQLVLKAMAKDPSQRFASASELLSSLPTS